MQRQQQSQGVHDPEATKETSSNAGPGLAARLEAGFLLTKFPAHWLSWLVLTGALVLLVLWLDNTDIPFITKLPTIPGFPIVGNLVQLGTAQPRRLAQSSKKYGPVFQIRLGNKVGLLFHNRGGV